ncbi:MULTISPECIES: hypothetical protein [Xanthomonas]|uniref:Uncharacterized protein n=1 Tax=Xanthomonas phaseoli pv. dieffenbachiae TaxID=92828 RepID=A0A1V9H1Y4_9XANT|nr:hypothetical protein [Xanthomonas phaseoli]MBO9768979.1 hypothetical protein [Xanthomonas phaseoli pv. dieffenbachiae]MBO9774367.1 hypothetical protein [Xanthomonas phaseoli pv. dieffenbachiae]MBO9780458.1 hypothetical protein [Xanthomonas phaseoli pv. dieffenbachiae]MBO9789587.1 hypothetical protein [Xanthomonas phaseoli pv. dieffenbachiae]MBO9795753.1 hypothetical protein [Xanthomonas phaseoli pv. dieffenbachiae]
MGSAAAYGITGSVGRMDSGIGKQVVAALGKLAAASLSADRAFAIAAHPLPGATHGNGVGGCHPRVIRSTQAGRIFLDR